jgi:glycosyltransferase involved in cell wall biosynthesis
MQANSEPLVTIGLPTYNRPGGLQKCLQSILNQTYKNLEIIISDNHSTDEQVQQIILTAAANDKRIKHFRQPVNIGLEGNFNFVFSKASADLFTWVSDDDYFDTNYIEACVTFLKNNPDYVLCSGIARYYYKNEFYFVENMLPVANKSAAFRVFSFFKKMEKNGKFYGVFRNKLFLQEPLTKTIGCDWNFMAKLAIFGKLGFSEKTFYHRSLDGNSSSRRKMINRAGFKNLKSLFFETYTAYLIASNIFNDISVKHQFTFVVRNTISIIVFFQIHYLILLNVIRKRLGYKKNKM